MSNSKKKQIPSTSGYGPLFPTLPLNERNNKQLEGAYQDAYSLLIHADTVLLESSKAFRDARQAPYSDIPEEVQFRTTKLINDINTTVLKLRSDFESLNARRLQFQNSDAGELKLMATSFELFNDFDVWLNNYQIDVTPLLLELVSVAKKHFNLDHTIEITKGQLNDNRK